MTQVHNRLKPDLRTYLRNLFKKKRNPAASHVLVILVSTCEYYGCRGRRFHLKDQKEDARYGNGMYRYVKIFNLINLLTSNKESGRGEVQTPKRLQKLGLRNKVI